MPTTKKKKSTALARRPAAQVPVPAGRVDVAATFTRLARDRNLDPVKLEKLVDLQLRLLDREAESAFNVAMTAAQMAMRPVAKDASNPSTASKYASLQALDREIRPIYTAHGFALSFNTGPTGASEALKVMCEVTHAGGYSKTYQIEMPADGKGAKGGDVMTKTHAVGSAASYGIRYLVRMIFNIQIVDDDGNKAGGRAPKRDYEAEGDTRFITVPQRRRLFAIAAKAHRSEEQIKAFLKAKLGIGSTREIRRMDYEAVCLAIEASGPLPGTGAEE